MTKKCSKCGVEKPVEEFYSDDRYTGGRRRYCISCCVEEGYKWRTKNIERVRQCERKRRNKNPKVEQNRKLQCKYGITLIERDSMILAQNGLCLLCSRPLTYNIPNVDHCHITGKIRGILCQGCNLGLGGFRDNYKALQKAADYIKTFYATTDFPATM